MRLDTTTGDIEITDRVHLHRGMTRTELLALETTWEDWVVIDDETRGFSTVVHLPNRGISSKTLLLVFVGPDPEPITYWNLGPWDLGDGYQPRPEGKLTKQLRAWFFEMSNVRVPVGDDWGHVDACHDPWNGSTAISCNYRERFDSDEDWQTYRRNNRF